VAMEIKSEKMGVISVQCRPLGTNLDSTHTTDNASDQQPTQIGTELTTTDDNDN